MRADFWGNVIQKYLVHLQKRRSLSRWTLTTSFVAPSQSNDCVLSLGSRHSVGPWYLNTQTREKVCVWCVFESHTHCVSTQKLSRWYCFGKWCPGAQPYFSQILFKYRWLYGFKNIEVVLKAVPINTENFVFRFDNWKVPNWCSYDRNILSDRQNL